MLVSVVVLTYNSADTISRTLDSIIDQAVIYGDQVEIIIGDDYSTDNTRNILLDYSQKYPNLINLVFNEKNLGVVNNYFNLMSRCSGKYIMECAGDDYWLPDKMNKQIEYMEEHSDVGMCCGESILYYEDIKKYSPIKHISEGIIEFDSLMLENIICAATVCFRKELISDYIDEIKPLTKEWIMEDYPLWLWICKKQLIFYMNTKLCVYSVRYKSISHPDSKQKQLAFLDNTNKIRCFFARNDHDLEIIRGKTNELLSDIYLNNNDMKNYRSVIKQNECKKNKLKFLFSYIPGYAKLLNRIRSIKSKDDIYYNDISELLDSTYLRT